MFQDLAKLKLDHGSSPEDFSKDLSKSKKGIWKSKTQYYFYNQPLQYCNRTGLEFMTQLVFTLALGKNSGSWSLIEINRPAIYIIYSSEKNDVEVKDAYKKSSDITFDHNLSFADIRDSDILPKQD